MHFAEVCVLAGGGGCKQDPLELRRLGRSQNFYPGTASTSEAVSRKSIQKSFGSHGVWQEKESAFAHLPGASQPESKSERRKCLSCLPCFRLEERPHCLCPSFVSCRARAKVRPGIKSKDASVLGAALHTQYGVPLPPCLLP